MEAPGHGFEGFEGPWDGFGVPRGGPRLGLEVPGLFLVRKGSFGKEFGKGQEVLRGFGKGKDFVVRFW